MTISNRTYDILKWACTVLLPASATLYAALGSLWGLPAVLEVTGTITAVATFLGVLIGISSADYARKTDGTLYLDKSGQTAYASFEYEPKHLATARLSVEKLGE